MNVKEEDIKRAIKWNEQEPACRAQNLVNKVLKGQPVKMIVIGGSNSAGGGITNHKQLFHQRFSQWWNQVIFPNTGSKLIVENLSLGGTGSDFFAFCFHNLLPKDEHPDIVVIELSVNDYGYLHGETAVPMELLTRRVLSLPSFPLVLYVSLVDVVSKKGESLKYIRNPHCHNLEDLGQRQLANYYEITLLSWRDLLCPVNSRTGNQQACIRPGMVNRDHLHIDIKGHAQVALMMIRYFQKALQREASVTAYGQEPQCIDMGLSAPLFADSSSLVTEPLCWAYITPAWGKSAIFQSLQVRLKRMHKFKKLKLENLEARMGYKGKDDRTDAFGGWIAAGKGSFLEFSFDVPVGYTSSSNRCSVAIVIRRLTQDAEELKIWLDDNESDAVTITGKTFGRVRYQTRVYFVASNVSQGQHTVSFEATGNKATGLLISGIVLGPAGIDGFRGYRPTGTLEKVWTLEDYEKYKTNLK